MSLNTRKGGRIGAAQEAVTLEVGAFGGVAIQVTGTYSGTLAFEGSTDGITFAALQVSNMATGVAVTTTTGTGQWSGSVVGLYAIRVRCSSYTSGAAWVAMATNEVAPGGAGGGGGGGGAVTVGDGADVALGATTDAKVLGDNDGTVSAKLRGLDTILNDVWDSVAHTLAVDAAVSIPGVATEAKQDTGNASLASIDGKITAVNTGAVVVSSSALPTGAATAAKQPALGTAGTPSADVISVQGVGGGTALPVSGTVTANLAAGTNNIGDVDVLSVPAPLSTTGGGTEATALRVTVASDSTGVLSVDDNGGALTVDGTVAATQSGTWTVQPGNTANTTAWLVTAGHGKTLKTYSATISADTDVVAAVTSKRIKVFAYSITTTSATENTVIFKSNGTAGTELWRVDLQAPTSVVVGANLAVTPPGWLFATTAGEKLTADVSAAVAIHLSLAYFDDDAA